MNISKTLLESYKMNGINYQVINTVKMLILAEFYYINEAEQYLKDNNVKHFSALIIKEVDGWY